MRVLVLASGRSDYLQDVCYAGLVAELGKAEVLEWPRNPAYHLPTRRYPKNLGYVRARPSLALSPARFSADVVVVGACKPDVVRAYLSLADRLPATAKTVWIDGGDRPELGGDLERLGHPGLLAQLTQVRPFDLILKREYLTGAAHPAHVHAFPLAVRSDFFPPVPASADAFDLVFWASVSHPDRAHAFSLLEGHYDCDANGSTPRRGIKHFDRRGARYLAALASAKLTLNVRGNGWDTLRFWEGLAAGACTLAQAMPLVLPDAPVDGEHLVWLDPTLSDLHARAGELLRDRDRRRRIAAAGRDWALRYHDHRARARRLLRLIG